MDPLSEAVVEQFRTEGSFGGDAFFETRTTATTRRQKTTQMMLSEIAKAQG
jgi:hypothetical protein